MNKPTPDTVAELLKVYEVIDTTIRTYAHTWCGKTLSLNAYELAPVHWLAAMNATPNHWLEAMNITLCKTCARHMPGARR